MRTLAAVSLGAARMTRFFLHVHDGISAFDDVGLELPDIAAAQAAAIELNSRILNEGAEGPCGRTLTGVSR